MSTLECANMRSHIRPKCEQRVNYIDENGFVYCAECGQIRQQSGRRARRLAPWELRVLKSGKPLPAYMPMSQRAYGEWLAKREVTPAPSATERDA